MLDILPKVKEIAEAICASEGYQLYDLSFISGSKGRGQKILIYVDKKEGITLADCERVSRELSPALDLEESLKDLDYILEVSSPGLDRPLREKWHFEAVVGEKIFVHSKESLGDKESKTSRFKVIGILKEVVDQNIVLKAEDNSEFTVPLGGIKKSHVVLDYEKLLKKKG